MTALAVALAGGALAGLWYGLPVRHVEVVGNRFVGDARVAQLAGARRDSGWLFYEEWSAGGLKRSPWIREAKVTKTWPDRLRIEVRERVPAVRLERDGRVVVADWDGTVLPGAPKVGPVIRGWGPDRTREAMEAARLLSRFNVEAVEYSPSGLTVKTRDATIWSGSLVSLRKYGASVTMFQAKRISIYPWGVSVQE
nr:FtsQ-type POTRA domain-containing protein [Deinococcus pimensis]